MNGAFSAGSSGYVHGDDITTGPQRQGATMTTRFSLTIVAFALAVIVPLGVV